MSILPEKNKNMRAFLVLTQEKTSLVYANNNVYRKNVKIFGGLCVFFVKFLAFMVGITV